eukprot:4069184-Pyramimonas_sp.AAC.1
MSPVRPPSSVGIVPVRALLVKDLLGEGRRAADRREQREGVVSNQPRQNQQQQEAPRNTYVYMCTQYI